MWTAKYKEIDRNGLRPEVKVTVIFTNGIDEIENTYEVLPADLKTDSFTGIVQHQIDILNSKDVQLTKTDIVLEQAIDPIKIDPLPIDLIL